MRGVERLEVRLHDELDWAYLHGISSSIKVWRYFILVNRAFLRAMHVRCVVLCVKSVSGIGVSHICKVLIFVELWLKQALVLSSFLA